MVGKLPAGVNLLKGFIEEPWMGFIVKGIYNDEIIDELDGITYCGDFDQLILDARNGKLDESTLL